VPSHQLGSSRTRSARSSPCRPRMGSGVVKQAILPFAGPRAQQVASERTLVALMGNARYAPICWRYAHPGEARSTLWTADPSGRDPHGCELVRFAVPGVAMRLAPSGSGLLIRAFAAPPSTRDGTEAASEHGGRRVVPPPNRVVYNLPPLRSPAS